MEAIHPLSKSLETQSLIPDHFFVTGERVAYNSAGLSTTDKIGIALTTFPETGLQQVLFQMRDYLS